MGRQPVECFRKVRLGPNLPNHFRWLGSGHDRNDVKPRDAGQPLTFERERLVADNDAAAPFSRRQRDYATLGVERPRCWFGG